MEIVDPAAKESRRMHFSFETDHTLMSWNAPYRRLATSKENLFYPTTFPAPFLLPYEMKQFDDLDYKTSDLDVKSLLDDIGEDDLENYTDLYVSEGELFEHLPVVDLQFENPLWLLDTYSTCDVMDYSKHRRIKPSKRNLESGLNTRPRKKMCRDLS